MKKSQAIPVSAALPLLLAALMAGCASSQPKEEAKPVAQETPVVAVKAEVQAPAKPVCKETADKTTAKSKTTKKTSKSKTVAQPDCVPAASVAPAAAAPAPARVAASGAYDLSKNKPVTDSTKAEAGQGTQVKGINEWQGEISGVPAAGSRFTKLKIGMSQQQVTDLVGQPTDQGAYVTGKAFIPFYFGSDKTRWEMVYKGQGRLIFSNQAGFGSGHYLTWVIHNANEGGYR